MVTTLTAMTSLAFVPVATFVIAVIAIELLVFDIMETVVNNYDYYMNDNEEAGTQVMVNTTINVVAFGVTKIGGAIVSQVKNARNCGKYGENVISSIKNSGFTTAEVNAQIGKFSKLGCSQTTIETLLKNPKCMFLGDDVLSFLGKQGGNQRLLAELVIGNGDDFTKALMKTEVLDDFCNLVWKYGNEVAKVLVDKGDDAVKAVSALDAEQATRLIGMSSASGCRTGWVVFPNDPNSFNPAGLTKSGPYNTNNGKIIKWLDSSNKAVYEWDEDLTYGAHYHVIGEDGNTRIPNEKGETHFYPGEIFEWRND